MKCPAWRTIAGQVDTRARRYAAVLERMIGPDGSFHISQSCDRFGAFHLLAQMALRRALPDGVSPGAGARRADIRHSTGPSRRPARSTQMAGSRIPLLRPPARRRRNLHLHRRPTCAPSACCRSASRRRTTLVGAPRNRGRRSAPGRARPSQSITRLQVQGKRHAGRPHRPQRRCIPSMITVVGARNWRSARMARETRASRSARQSRTDRATAAPIGISDRDHDLGPLGLDDPTEAVRHDRASLRGGRGWILHAIDRPPKSSSAHGTAPSSQVDGSPCETTTDSVTAKSRPLRTTSTGNTNDIEDPWSSVRHINE